mmetsp:Transcript_73579/g.116996  ORF Transcript_73579/g.116996 Transcript_73579/m.116996 type:complete len:225 (-) Transcript_73579:90-764(-)
MQHLGRWIDVRCHAPKLLPVKWGIWRTHFCDFQPANRMGGDLVMFAYDQDPRDFPKLTLTPRFYVVFDSLLILSSDPCLVSLMCGTREVSWLRLPNKHFKESLCALLRHATTLRHTTLREHRISQKETELANREERVRQREIAISRAEETQCPSLAESSDDEVPFGSTVVFDWPLSRSEKHLRLVNALDRQRIAEVASERRKRSGAASSRRFSAPATSRARVAG